MKCPKCGKEIANDSVFCEYCGTQTCKSHGKKILWIMMVILSVLGIWGGIDAVSKFGNHTLQGASVMEEAVDSIKKDSVNKQETVNVFQETERKSLVGERLGHEEELRQLKKRSLIAQGYVDLELPSGTLWQKEAKEIFDGTYKQAIRKYGKKQLPSKNQWIELINNCRWEWYEYVEEVKSIKDDGTQGWGLRSCQGYKVYGKNGNYIVLEAQDYGAGGVWAQYFSSTSSNNSIWCTYISADTVDCGEYENFYQLEAKYFNDYENWRRFYIHLVIQL